jgi:hypothetical protein
MGAIGGAAFAAAQGLRYSIISRPTIFPKVPMLAT